MLRLPKITNRPLSVSLSLMVVLSMAILLMASLAVMLHYSRKAIKEEALQKASQTLEGTARHIDNILLNVEQATGNFHFNLTSRLADPSLRRSGTLPDVISTYSRKLVETTPYVTGCAIAFKRDYFPDREYFMAYFRRQSASAPDSIIQLDSFGNTHYSEQIWFTKPMSTGHPAWLNPFENMDIDMDPIFTYCLPIAGADGQPVAVIGVDVSLSLLSQIVAEVKPSPHSYCTLLDRDGLFIVHPSGKNLAHETAYSISGQSGDPSAGEAVKAMVSGHTGYRPFRMNGNHYYVFYKPFKLFPVPGRYMEDLGWSTGFIYPEDDIFGDYNDLLYYVLTIAVVGLLLLFLLSRAIINRQLKPLQMLTASAQRIAQGHYAEPIPDSRQHDEIGRLQDFFQQMQQSLAVNIGELEQLTATMQQRGDRLRAAYIQAQKADHMRTAFLHNMTNQMTAPSDAIDKDVEALCAFDGKDDKPSTTQLTDSIQENGNAITEILNNLINISDEEIGKEVGYE